MSNCVRCCVTAFKPARSGRKRSSVAVLPMLALLVAWALSAPGLAQSAEARQVPLRVAVASNFAPTAQALGRLFTEQTNQPVAFSNGSTGGLFAQIIQGAPFEVFMSADAARPRELAHRGLIVDNTRQTYALGRLVLWSAVHEGRVLPQGLLANEVVGLAPPATAPALDSPWWADPHARCRDALVTSAKGRVARVAIANPVLAPYGLAAQQAIEHLGWRQSLAPRLVQGANIAQAFHMVATGNADFGFVALSQLLDGARPGVCRWLLPQALHAPIEQQLVVLGAAKPSAQQFARFVRSDLARQLIAAAGYALPDPPE